MAIDRRITNGLAWAGVFLVVGVPTADLLSAQFLGTPTSPPAVEVAAGVEPVAPIPAPASQRPAAPMSKPTQVAAVTPVKPAVAPAPVVATPAAEPAVATASADAVDNFLQSGRSMPSYITGANAPAAPAQAAATPPARTPIVTTPEAIDPVEVASIPSQKVAPMPMPLSMRPQPVAVAAMPDPAIVIPPTLTPAAPAAVVRPPVDVTAADLDDWETGPLSEFLARRQPGNADVDTGYDEDGFFLDEGPNRPRARVIAREEPFFIIN